ncbi:hypothetical protein [Thalassospira lohafexi]|uniref:DUF2190 domain-containing protein n=1 Tax=Thalassospira lohafexi TaxID=744227 RepID=A0A2N3L0L9_9PROT|nr:hypothetical protein [Thalassospira lohafexi]PKR56348.1 hypothetical protein COO92_21320 [Thalassospira lohafexi]
MFITGIKTDQVDTVAQFTPGALGSTYDGKVWKYVTYDHGTGELDLAVGDVVYYVDDSGYGSNTVTADASDSSGAEIGAGVVQAAVTEDGSFFWIQLSGAATLAVALGGSAGDGDPLTAVGAADKALTKAAEADSAATYKSVVAIAVDADAKEIICRFPW